MFHPRRESVCARTGAANHAHPSGSAGQSGRRGGLRPGRSPRPPSQQSERLPRPCHERQRAVRILLLGSAGRSGWLGVLPVRSHSHARHVGLQPRHLLAGRPRQVRGARHRAESRRAARGLEIRPRCLAQARHRHQPRGRPAGVLVLRHQVRLQRGRAGAQRSARSCPAVGVLQCAAVQPSGASDQQEGLRYQRHARQGAIRCRALAGQCRWLRDRGSVGHRHGRPNAVGVPRPPAPRVGTLAGGYGAAAWLSVAGREHGLRLGAVCGIAPLDRRSRTLRAACGRRWHRLPASRSRRKTRP